MSALERGEALCVAAAINLALKFRGRLNFEVLARGRLNFEEDLLAR